MTPICVISTSCISSVLSTSAESDDSFLSSEKGNDDQFNTLTSSPNKLTTPKVAQWGRQSICDHDAFTWILLEMILDAQLRMEKGDNSTGLLPLDPIHIPEFVFNQEEILRGAAGKSSPRRVQADIE